MAASAGQFPQISGFGPDVLDSVFRVKAGETFAGASANFAYIVAKVTQVQAGDVAQAAREAQAIQPQVSQEMSQSDLPQLVAAAAAEEIKPKVDPTRARLAIGLEAPSSSGKASGKAP
jgi:hypothetical protein